MLTNTSSLSSPATHLVRVLLVDDAARVRVELRQLLELTGLVQVIGEAEDGQQGVLMASILSPDVILMDLEMPFMDGFEATRLIKLEHPTQRVVILSVHVGSQEEQHARAAGADGFVIKGSDYHTLLNAILDRDDPFDK